MEKLTLREAEIVKLLMSGLSNREIAQQLHISIHTVKLHLEHIYDKYSIHNRVLLALFMKKFEKTLLDENFK